MAPLLAVLAWLAVDALLGEQAELAQAGRSYPLSARSNCRYASGRCDLVNGDLVLALSARTAGGESMLEVVASVALDSLLISLSASALDGQPQPMEPMDAGRRHWLLTVPSLPENPLLLRLAATASGSAYFAETGAEFHRQ